MHWGEKCEWSISWQTWRQDLRNACVILDIFVHLLDEMESNKSEKMSVYFVGI